jgi:hypothetical protein
MTVQITVQITMGESAQNFGQQSYKTMCVVRALSHFRKQQEDTVMMCWLALKGHGQMKSIASLFKPQGDCEGKLEISFQHAWVQASKHNRDTYIEVVGGRILQPQRISFKQTTSKQDIEDIQILLRAILSFKL